jgi:cell division protein FtsQ
MSTLHVRLDALRNATSPFPVVKGVRAYAHPPHMLRIEVVEQVPVAQVQLGGRAVAVGSDGTLLHDIAGASGLPALAGGGAPGAARLTSPGALRAVTLLAEASPELRARVARVTFSHAHGLVAVLRHGPALYFGGPDRFAAKWAAAAAVLADAGSSGARYVDLRIPERPAAGGLAPSPAGSPTTSPGPSVPASPTAPPTVVSPLATTPSVAQP